MEFELPVPSLQIVAVKKLIFFSDQLNVGNVLPGETGGDRANRRGWRERVCIGGGGVGAIPH
jgi:hypothetical protein